MTDLSHVPIVRPYEVLPTREIHLEGQYVATWELEDTLQDVIAKLKDAPEVDAAKVQS